MTSQDDPESTQIMRPCEDCRRRLLKLSEADREGFRLGHYEGGRCDRCAHRDPALPDATTGPPANAGPAGDIPVADPS